MLLEAGSWEPTTRIRSHLSLHFPSLGGGILTASLAGHPIHVHILSREYERKGGYHLRNHSRQSALSVPLRCQLRKNAVVAQKLKGRRAGGRLVWSFVVGNVRCCGGGSGSRFSGE